MSEKDVRIGRHCARVAREAMQEKLDVVDRITTIPDSPAIKDLREAVRELTDAEQKANEGRG